MGGCINFGNAIANKKLFDLIYIFDDKTAFIIAIFVDYKRIIYFFSLFDAHTQKNQIKLIQFVFFSLYLRVPQSFPVSFCDRCSWNEVRVMAESACHDHKWTST